MFLDTGNGWSVSLKDVTAINSVSELVSEVYIGDSKFEVPLPRDVIISLIESRNKSKDSISNVEKLLTQIYKGQVTSRP